MKPSYHVAVAWRERRLADAAGHAALAFVFVAVTVVLAKAAQYAAVDALGAEWGFPQASFAGLLPVLVPAYLIDRFLLRSRENCLG